MVVVDFVSMYLMLGLCFLGFFVILYMFDIFFLHLLFSGLYVSTLHIGMSTNLMEVFVVSVSNMKFILNCIQQATVHSSHPFTPCSQSYMIPNIYRHLSGRYVNVFCACRF